MLQSFIRHGATRSVQNKLPSLPKPSARSSAYSTTRSVSFDPQQFITATSNGASSGLRHKFFRRPAFRRVPLTDHDGSLEQEHGNESRTDSQGSQHDAPTTEPKEEVESVDGYGSEEESLRSIHKSVLRIMRQEENAHDLLIRLLKIDRLFEYFAALPPVLVVEIMKSIDPSAFVTPYRLAHSKAFGGTLSQISISNNTIGQNIENISRPRHVSVAAGYVLRHLTHFFKAWLDAPLTLTQPTVKLILRAARDARDGMLAKAAFEAAQKAQDLSLDTEIYNLYFEARCWNGVNDAWEHRRLRVTKHTLELRNPKLRKKPNIFFDGYHTGANGLNAEVTKAFGEMVADGLIPNTDTFCHLMTAMGREGDIKGVAAILQQVWDVDVTEIMASASDDIFFENDISAESPNYPSQKVLFTIAHIYGSNNQIPIALRVVDHLSRKFNIEIDHETWTELAGWTFCLSTKRRHRLGTANQRKRAKAKDRARGLLPPETMESLWQTMVQEPYNVQPDIVLRDLRIKTFFRNGQYVEMLDMMREAVEYLGFTPKSLLHLRRLYQASPKGTDGILEKGQQQAETELMNFLSNAKITTNWVRLLLSRSRGWKSPKDPNFQYVQVPNIIDEFSPLWLSRRAIGYEIQGGYVQFSGHTSPGVRLNPQITREVVQHKVELNIRGKASSYFLVHHLGNAMGKPYMEKSRIERGMESRKLLVKYGSHEPLEPLPSWLLSPSFGNWIWSKDGGSRSSSPKDVVVYL